MPARPRTSAPVWVGALLALTVATSVTALLASVLLPGPDRWAPAPTTTSDEAMPPSGDASTGTSSRGFRVWAVDEDGRTVRWDPCTPIALVVDPSGAPPGALEDLAAAVARLVEAGAPPMVLEGTTAERPGIDRRPYQPERYGERWAPVLVAWAPPGEGGLPLDPTDRAIALPTAVRVDGAHAFVTGQLVLNAERTDLVAGFEDRSISWGATLLHELGHLAGLGHVDDPDELMSARPGRGPVRLGEGDLAGLAHLAGDGRCAPAPRARALPVARADRADPTGVNPGR